MNVQEQFSQCYRTAREYIKLNRPKDAYKYVKLMIKIIEEMNKNVKSAVIHAKNKNLIDQFNIVTRELYNVGVTNYVLEVFNLPIKQKIVKNDVPESKPDAKAPDLSDIDLSGLLESLQDWHAKLFESKKRAFVEINASSGSNNYTGTGFIISKNGYLLTCDHVIYDEENEMYCSKVQMKFRGDRKQYRVSIIISDKAKDIALCSFNPDEIDDFESVKLIDDYDKVKIGIECMVVGNPFGEGLTTTIANVRYPHSHDDDNDLVISAQTNNGDSGGPVLNRNGEVIGINKSSTTTINGQVAHSFRNATPADEIKKLLDSWLKANNIEL